MPTDPSDTKVDLGATQEVAIEPPPEAYPWPVHASGQAADVAAPIHEVAKQLGEPYWVKRIADVTGFDGKPAKVVQYDGPGWVLAGVMAGNHLDEHSLITKAKLIELGAAVADIPIGVHTHQPAKKGA